MDMRPPCSAFASIGVDFRAAPARDEGGDRPNSSPRGLAPQKPEAGRADTPDSRSPGSRPKEKLVHEPDASPIAATARPANDAG